MNEPIRIDAVVDESEREIFVAAASQLAEALGAASKAAWPVELRFWDTFGERHGFDPAPIAIVSLLRESADGAALPEVEQRVRDTVLALVESGVPSIFVTTIFRYGAGQTGGTERIRRLNFLAIQLSWETGIGVFDVDRIFAHVGAEELECGFRPSGRTAAEVAGYEIVAGLLAIGLDDVVPDAVREAATTFQGPLWSLGTVVNRRIRAGPLPTSVHGSG